MTNLIQKIKDIMPPRLKQYAKKFCYIKRYFEQEWSVYPGHFYSPIPDIKQIIKEQKIVWPPITRDVKGINLNEAEQLKLLETLCSNYYKQLPFKSEKQKEMRYFFDNPSYSYSDAIFLHSMIRHLKPKRIIEVGSGYSSCVMLDTNELFMDNSIKISFIEPYPQLLLSLLKEQDKNNVVIFDKKLQDIPLTVFEALNANDILFIDSTHVSKINSDVNYLFFEILPSLKKGVLIHLHDIHYPFEYSLDHISRGVLWNEAYMLRTFLQYNSSFKVVLFNTFLEHFYPEWFETNMPLCLIDKGGSIWLQKC